MEKSTISHSDRSFILRFVQPGLLGLMDGSISTLAPLFAAAFSTHSSHVTFLIGTSAAVGAGISMAFAEALSDTGEHTGRGNPVVRGSLVGALTFIGGILHTLPFLLPSINQALSIAYLIVGCELIIISYVRYRFFKMSFALSALQVIAGGLLVALAGLLIGSS